MSIISSFNSVCRPRKRISVAVVGFPSSGKSYLIYDLITSLRHVGFVPEKLPLTYPYNSLGGFFNDVFVNGGLEQTERVACRNTNHYGAYLVHKKSGRRISLDFLNIPGETFSDAEKQLRRYGEMFRAIRIIKKGVFCMSTWKNPSGKICYLLEPTLRIQKKIMSSTLKQWEDSSYNVADQNYQAARRNEYQSWRFIFSELNYGLYQRTGRKSISGKYLLDHFFSLNSDSIFATLYDVWNVMDIGLSQEECMAQHVFHDFSYLHYAVHSTDLIVCDKLFVKNQNTVSNSQQNFLEMMDVLAGLFPFGERAPQTYMAFRGVDLMMSKYAETYKNRFSSGTLVNKEQRCYEEVTKQIKVLIDNGGNPSSLDVFGSDILIDPSPRNCEIPTGCDFALHVQSRLGGDNAHGFRSLLQASGIKKPLQELQESVPPHVYFTATPIDDHFRFYENDPANVTRFIYKERNRNSISSGKISHLAFHVEIAQHRAQHLCFGTLQILHSIMNHNGINI